MSKVLLILWIVSSVLIHLNAVVPWLYASQIGDKNFTGPHLDFWRTFGETDKRYLKADNLIISLEGMMVFVDLPLSIIWFLLVLVDSPRQYIFQLIVSCFQLFGTSMYFLGAYLRDFKDISADPNHFWGGFVAGNGTWWIIPLFLILHAMFVLSRYIGSTHVGQVTHAKKHQ